MSFLFPKKLTSASKTDNTQPQQPLPQQSAANNATSNGAAPMQLERSVLVKPVVSVPQSSLLHSQSPSPPPHSPQPTTPPSSSAPMSISPTSAYSHITQMRNISVAASASPSPSLTRTGSPAGPTAVPVPSAEQLTIPAISISAPSSPMSAAPTTILTPASSSSSTDLAALALSAPIPEDRVSDEVIALRQHFSALTNLSRRTFSLGDTLGTGTFGRVRLVTYTPPLNLSTPLVPSRRHFFALKMLRKSEIIRLKQVEHIKAEKSILSQLVHPFIVTLYVSFQDEHHLYMLMEYVIGGELFSQLRKVGRFSNDTARFYAAEIVLALQYLHGKNIVYRDLKPENLLIDREGHMKITDFGFAKRVEDRTWTLCGTPEYLAPEIIQSKGHGRAVDWWALGILIYEMLAGYPPFYDENPFGIYQKILAGKCEFPKHFDPNAKDLVRKLLTADRTKRFGCLRDGAEDVKRHKWFKGVDWQRVHDRKIKPPYVPGFASQDDTSNFDKYPEDEKEDHAPLSTKDRDQFADF